MQHTVYGARSTSFLLGFFKSPFVSKKLTLKFVRVHQLNRHNFMTMFMTDYRIVMKIWEHVQRYHQRPRSIILCVSTKRGCCKHQHRRWPNTKRPYVHIQWSQNLADISRDICGPCPENTDTFLWPQYHSENTWTPVLAACSYIPFIKVPDY